MRDAVIVDAVRTPIGKAKPGGLHTQTHPVDLLAGTLKSLAERTGIAPPTWTTSSAAAWTRWPSRR
jgi:acetyl-CoA acyltransferase